MMDQIAYGIISLMAGLLLFALVYVAVWTPKERMKGHAGRKCNRRNR
jgi:hypothetical protein